ncbi:hypothetical protein M8J77_026088 [Diaphorina citri]|nr:hypothetical protein M8J77_026088 [Diaphorina citri]
MSCSDENVQMRFLEYSIHSGNCQSQSVHNFLVLMYARHAPAKLSEYLTMQGTDLSLLNYDVHYALRVCREYNRVEACVTLCCVLGLWEAAVDLALTNLDIDVAKQTALLPNVHDGQPADLKRRLWLKIAQHVVSERNDIKTALEFLDESDLISIEDILPFFSDFTCMDQFKHAICASLEQYNQHIVDLKEDMSEATRSAEQSTLTDGYLMPETEGFIHAIQDQVMKTRNYIRHIMKVQIDSDLCRLCNQITESIQHLSGGCSVLAPKEYTNRHNLVGNIIHQELLKKVTSSNKTCIPHYLYKPAPVIENENIKICWDISMQTETNIINTGPILCMWTRQLILSASLT